MKLIAASILLVASFATLRAQEPATPKKVNEPVTGAIEGRVVNESGQPLAGAFLMIRAVNGPVSARTAVSDADGNFHVSGLEPTLYAVSANLPAYAPLRTDPNTPSFYRIGDNVRLELIRGGVITGTVTNAAGEPVIGVHVRATMVRDARGELIKTTSFASEQTTDDRGIYRIYGLLPGTYLVSAGGAGFSPTFNPYDQDAPTFAPSSTRDNAAEVVVRSGDESNTDIRYRGEPGHVVSGTVKLIGANGVSIMLAPAGSAASIATTVQAPGARGFSFSGIGDGEYEVLAQEVTSNPMSVSNAEVALSDVRHVTMKGADVTGIELVTHSLPSVSGKITLESSKVAECQGKRPPLLSEALVLIQRPEKELEKPDALIARMFANSASPDANGVFVLRNLAPGKYQFSPQFYAHYWYVQSITMSSGAAKPQKIDAAANWTSVKSGDQLMNLNITLAQGAASLRGRVPVAEGAAIQAGMSVYLVPNEADKADDVLRFFVTEVSPDGTFTFNNLAPGRYLAVVDTQQTISKNLRLPESAAIRTKLRRTAETKKNEIELKPCQNLTDYQLKQ